MLDHSFSTTIEVNEAIAYKVSPCPPNLILKTSLDYNCATYTNYVEVKLFRAKALLVGIVTNVLGVPARVLTIDKSEA